MTLVVHALGAYASYGRDEYSWRPGDFEVNQFVKAIKRDPVAGYARLRGADGTLRQVDHGNRQYADEHFAQWAVRLCQQIGAAGSVLVPVPSTSALQFGVATAPTRLAERLAELSDGNLTVGHWLRFTKALVKARDGGPRDSDTLSQAMAVSAGAGPATIILVDDVSTTGGHLIASARMLRQRGCTVETAIVAAQTVWSPHPNPWVVDAADIEPVLRLPR